MFLALALTLSAPVADVSPPPRLVGELVELKIDAGTLYGIIDLPATPGPWPVVMIHAGQGPTDRDGNNPIMRIDILKTLGRSLAAQGFAVLRIDKRGIGASANAMSKEEDVRLEAFSEDVISWVAFLRKDPRFTRVGYIGHSEEALIGLLAAKDAKFDAYMSLCGPGRPLLEVLREQLKKNLPADQFKESDAILTELAAGRTVKDVSKSLNALFRPSVQPYLISMLKPDPAKLFAELTCAVLVVSGSTDIQVTAEDARRLGEANPKAKVVTIEHMNHVLREVEGTHRLVQLPSYTDPSLPLHAKVVPEIGAFFKQSLGGKDK